MKAASPNWAAFDPSYWSQIQPLLEALLDRPVDTADRLSQWLVDLCTLDDAFYEYASRRYIDHTCHTDDEEIERVYLHVVEKILPRLRPAYQQLKSKYLSAAEHLTIDDAVGVQLRRRWSAEVKLFRDTNVPLQTQTTKLNAQYAKLCGAMVVQFEGKPYTLQQMVRFLEEPDRATREQAWVVASQRRLQDRQAFDDLFDEMLGLRHQIAQNADLPDYRAYVWQDKQRFDYTPADCQAFADATERLCMPLVEKLTERRCAELGLARLRPWDLQVDPHHRPPLRPFDAGRIDDFVFRIHTMIERISPELGHQFARLQIPEHLDLDSRPGKRPGGYQCGLPLSRHPFIFMNAAGLQRDVETLLHEAGHAFHFFASCDIDVSFVRNAPLEFCEVASMSMELMGHDHLDVFYDPQSANRARREHLEGIIKLLPWVATIDGLQHWLYAHPGHDREQRTRQWLGLHRRFSSDKVDFKGYESALEARWQQQQHLFGAPFYYIEYGIAQLGALQIWFNYRREPAAAQQQLLEALALGGTRPLPELFVAAGIHFDFSEATMAPLIQELQEVLETLPA